jgi:hypothetical protein
MKGRSITGLVLIITILFSITAVSNFALAAPTGTIHVVKNGTTDQTTWALAASAIGTTIKVDLYITGASGIWSWGVRNILWNPAVLQYKSCSQGPYISDEYDSLFIRGTADNTYGILQGGVGCAVSGQNSQVEATEGLLCTINFIVLGEGNANIQLDGAVLVEDSISGVETPIPVDDITLTVGDTTGMPTLAVSSFTSPTGDPVDDTPVYYGVPNPLGTTSYTSGVSVTASITSPVTISGITYDCIGWVGTGDVPATGTGTSTTFIITQDSTIAWQWAMHADQQFSLTVTSEHGSPDPAGTSTVTEGSSVTCSVPTTEAELGGELYNVVYEDGTYYICTGWVGTGDVPATGTGTSTTFTVTQDSTITWQWEEYTGPTPVTLTVTSDHGTPNPASGTQILNTDDSVTCTVPTNSVTVNGVTYNTVTEGGVIWVCTGWVGTGDVAASGTGTSTTFTMTQDSTITWQWMLLPASLDITTNKGGQGWNASANVFGPEELVTITANVTSDGGVPRAGQQVVLTLTYANGESYAIPAGSTNANGVLTTSIRLQWASPNPKVAFGVANITGTATMAEKTLNDSCTFMYNYMLAVTNVAVRNSGGQTGGANGPSVSRYFNPLVYVDITVKNYNWSTTADDKTNFTLSVTIYDSNKVPISYAVLPESIQPIVSASCNPTASYSGTFTFTLGIPTFAYVGQAKLYVNAYTENPLNLGIPLCPETTANLVITASRE